ncbi:MAG: hypothetical protein KDD85_05335 [Parvularculaceae bacterium]|nr:hypothetical protein [Parvularculaceae bacterium]
MARKLVIAAASFAVFAASAAAETLVIRPDPCPAPADAPKFIMFLDTDAGDLNPDRAFSDDVVVYYAVPRRGWASARILARFDIEGGDRRADLAGVCGR